MGWNDRLPEDPYTPPESFYRDRDDYEAWLEYVEAQLDADTTSGLSSQNIDPQTLSQNQQQEAPSRQTILSRIWVKIFGQKISEIKKQEGSNNRGEKDASVPF